jgi:hypothetical protein
MKKILVFLLLLFVLFSGCNEEPVGKAVKEPKISGSAELKCPEIGAKACTTSEGCSGVMRCTDIPGDNCPECKEEWNCNSWGSCVNGLQKRKCIDKSDCGTENSKPKTSRKCDECKTGLVEECITEKNCAGTKTCLNGMWTQCNDIPKDGCPVCTEDWDCEEWSACDKGIQKRKCTDKNDCTTFEKVPDTLRLCTEN